jgi:hypothetical protein
MHLETLICYRRQRQPYGVSSVPTSPYEIVYEETQVEESWFQSVVYEDVSQPIMRNNERDQSNVSLISVSRIGIDSTFNPAPLEPPSEGYYNIGFEKDAAVVGVESPSLMADGLEGKNSSVVDKEVEKDTTAVKEVECLSTTDSLEAKNQSTAEIVYAPVNKNKDKRRCKSDVPISEPIYARVNVSMKRKYKSQSVLIPAPKSIAEGEIEGRRKSVDLQMKLPLIEAEESSSHEPSVKDLPSVRIEFQEEEEEEEPGYASLKDLNLPSKESQTN